MLTSTIATLAGAFALVLVAAIATMLVIVFDVNDAEAEHQSLRLDVAIESQGRLHRLAIEHILARRSVSEALAEGALDRLQAGLVAGFAGDPRYEGVLLATVDGRVLAGVERGRPAGQAAFDQFGRWLAGFPVPSPAAAETGGSPVRIRLAVEEDRIRSVAQIGLADLPWPADRLSDRPAIAVLYREMTAPMLAAIGDLYRLRGLSVTREQPQNPLASRALMGPDGAPRAWLTWTPDRPGDALLRQFALAALVMVLTFAAILFLVIRRLRNAAREISLHERRIGLLAGQDELSNLPNRRTFDMRLDQELAQIGRLRTGLAVLMLDLDRFKAVNDTYGHKAGDELIRQVADRLMVTVRAGDTVARLGGDEFGIIQMIVNDASSSGALGQRILDALTRPFLIAGVEVSIGCSIGIARAPSDGSDRETLLRLADTALYQAKNEGRNRFVYFEERMNRSLQLKRMVEEDLRQAIRNDLLAIHFQPQVSADGSTIVGVEALVRWPHPVHGMVPPSEFIAIAEERGLIVPLSEWVLRRACQEAKRWDGVKLAVNVSPVQFRHKDFVANIIAIIEETGFDPTRLELELTEGVVVEDADAAENALMDLRAYGIGLALDDFGIGYSSLIYLRRFAFDKIKIDRSFLEYMETTGESAILVHSVVHLGRALGLRVCAEGVETTEQHRFLQAIGCHEVQGFLFSKPVPPKEIDRLLQLKRPFAEVEAA